MGILFGLGAALALGTADFWTRFAARSLGFFRTLFYLQMVGVIFLTVYMFASGEQARLVNPPLTPLLIGIFASLIGAVGAASIFRAYEVGVLSLVAPIAASYSGLTTLLSVLSGEALTPQRALGVVCSVVGVMLASISQPGSEAADEAGAVGMPARGLVGRLRTGLAAPGVRVAIVAALCFGVNNWLMGFYVAPVFGGVTSTWIVRVTIVIAIVVAGLLTRQSFAAPEGRATWGYLFGGGILNAGAFVLTYIGQATDQVSVVTVLASFFSVVTVLLAWVFLRERLALWQWGGIGLILLGVLLVSVRL